jgi:hypothetical protein
MFNLTSEQQARLALWITEQDATCKADEHHYGCIGGGYSYIFTPTSLGVVVRVKNNLTKEEIDLTDYEAW